MTYIYTDIFKGDTGLFGIVPLLDTGNAKNNFLIIGYLSTVIMFAYLWIINKVIRVRYGLIMASINDDEDVAHGIGININKVKIIAFVCAATMVGIIGWFYAHYFSSFAGITYLPLTFMLKILLVLMIGGRAQVFGCVVGGYFVSFLEMLMMDSVGRSNRCCSPLFCWFCCLFSLKVYLAFIESAVIANICQPFMCGGKMPWLYY